MQSPSSWKKLAKELAKRINPIEKTTVGKLNPLISKGTSYQD